MTKDPGSAFSFPPITDNTSPADPGNAGQSTNTGVVQPVNTSASGLQSITVTVGKISYPVTLSPQVDQNAQVQIGKKVQGSKKLAPGDQSTTESVSQKIAEITSWYDNLSQRKQMINQMYAAGLITSKNNPASAQVLLAWSLLVQEASLEGNTTPEDLLAKAAQGGWNAINPTLSAADLGVYGTGNSNSAPDPSTTTSQTVYTSYLDPATIMGAQADAWFRLLGRNPTQSEYQGFLNSVYGYQDEANTGKFETKTSSPQNKVTYDPSTGQPVSSGTTDSSGPSGPTTSTSEVSQRGIGTRGLQFLAGQAAMANPEEGAYQAATTYFNAFIKALSGPASGMQASGPTTTVP